MVNQIIKNIWNSGYEWKSKLKIFGLPLVHIALGRDSQTGKFLVAKGVIAIGQFAIGVVALGQFSVGIFAVAQLALSICFGLGQFAIGYACIAQFGIGEYVLAQFGFGKYVWSMTVNNPEALAYFNSLL